MLWRRYISKSNRLIWRTNWRAISTTPRQARLEINVEPVKKKEERMGTTDYAAMADDMRRLAGLVTGMAAQQACEALAAQYEELARGVPPHLLSKAAQAKH